MKNVPFDRVLLEVEGVFKKWGMEIITAIPNDVTKMQSISGIAFVLGNAVEHVDFLASQERTIRDVLLAFYTGYQDQLDEEEIW